MVKCWTLPLSTSMLLGSILLAQPFIPTSIATKASAQPRTTAQMFVGLRVQSRLDGGEPRLDVPVKELGFVRAFRGHRKLVQGMAFSPDGRQLVTGSLDKTLLLWDVATGKIVRRFTGHTGNVQCVAFTPDGKHVLSGSAFGDATLRLWDARTGKEIRQFKGHSAPGALYALQVLPSGKHFVSCGYDKTIRFWDLGTGRQVRQVKHWTHPTEMTYVITFPRDGRYAVLGGPLDRRKCSIC